MDDEKVKVVYTCGGKRSYEKFLQGESVLTGIFGRGNRICEDCTKEKDPPVTMSVAEFKNNGIKHANCYYFGKVVYEGEIVL